MQAKLVAFAWLILLVSGCHERPRPGGNGQTETGFPFQVVPSTWLLLHPTGPARSPVGLDVERLTDFGSPGPRLVDSYQCTSLLVAEGWLAGYFGPSRPGSLLFSGVRDQAVDQWLGDQAGDESGLHNYALSYTPLTKESDLLVSNFVAGPADSKVWANLTAEGATSESGSYWCLAGPAQFAGGSHQFSNAAVRAQGQAWSESFAHGFLARVRGSNIALKLEVAAGGEARPLPLGLAAGPAIDATFCSPAPGEWTVSLSELTGDNGWQFFVEIYDIKDSPLACGDAWQSSPIGDPPRPPQA